MDWVLHPHVASLSPLWVRPSARTQHTSLLYSTLCLVYYLFMIYVLMIRLPPCNVDPMGAEICGAFFACLCLGCNNLLVGVLYTLAECRLEMSQISLPSTPGTTPDDLPAFPRKYPPFPGTRITSLRFSYSQV